MGIIANEFKRACEELRKEVNSTLEEYGHEAVEYAKRNGNYRDRTGHLRNSNSCEVRDGTLTVRNTAEYASQVEAKGYDVISGAVLELKNKLGV